MIGGMEFSPAMIFVMALSFMGILVHSSLMYEDKENLKRDSKKAWALSMTAGIGITGWMSIYGYYINFF